MLKNDCFELGHISRTTGYKGTVIFFLDVDKVENYKKIKTVYIDIQNELVPFVVKKIVVQEKSSFATVTLETIDTKEKAQSILQKKLFLPLTELPALKGKKFYYHEVIGFQVEDAIYGVVGTVAGIYNLPQQAIFQVNAGKKEVLIPAVNEVIMKIDRNNKILFIKAPEGLIELYLK